MTVTPELLESTSDDDVAVAQPPRRRRHSWRWIGLAIVLVVVAAGTTFIVKPSTKSVIGWNGGVVDIGDSGVVRHEDPFGAEPGSSWGEATYRPGATATNRL
jgi:hypothetical protein